MADDSEQPVPWVFLVAMRGAASAMAPLGRDEIVDALGALPVAALDQHRAAAHRQQPLALALDRGFVIGNRLIEQRRGFRHIGRDQRCQRNEFCAQRIDGFGCQQPIARGCDHHRIEHDMLRRPSRQPGGDGVDHGEVRHHADLDRADVEIGEHGVDLRGDEFRRHLMNAGDACACSARSAP